MKVIKLSELNEQKEMIWLDNPTKYDYVRESEMLSASPLAKPIGKNATYKFSGRLGGLFRKKDAKFIEKIGKLKLIGYEKPRKVNPDAKFPCLYSSTYFWLKPYDRGMPDEKLCYGNPDAEEWYRPCEAIKIIN